MDKTRKRIEVLLGEAVYERYKDKKHGIRTCIPEFDIDFLLDLRDLYISSVELDTCNLSISSCCSLNKVKERINTL